MPRVYVKHYTLRSFVWETFFFVWFGFQSLERHCSQLLGLFFLYIYFLFLSRAVLIPERRREKEEEKKICSKEGGGVSLWDDESCVRAIAGVEESRRFERSIWENAKDWSSPFLSLSNSV